MLSGAPRRTNDRIVIFFALRTESSQPEALRDIGGAQWSASFVPEVFPAVSPGDLSYAGYYFA